MLSKILQQKFFKKDIDKKSFIGIINNVDGGKQKTPKTKKNERFLGSSAVEHPAVNRRVVGSNPTRGANFIKGL